MAFTDDQIRDFALKLEQKGATPAKIRQFVSSAKQEQQSQQFGPVLPPQVKAQREAPVGPAIPKDVAVKREIDISGPLVGPTISQSREIAEDERIAREEEKGLPRQVIEEVGGGILGGVKGAATAFVRGSEAVQRGLGRLTGFEEQVEADISSQQPAIESAREAVSEFREQIGASPTSEKIGEVAGEIGLGLALTKGIPASSIQLPKNFIQGATQFLPASLSTTGVFSALSKGDLPDIQEGLTGLAIDIAVPVLGKAAKEARSFVGQGIVRRTPKQLATDLRRGQDIGRAITENIGPTLTRKGLIQKIEKQVSSASSQLDDLIKQVDTGFVPVRAKAFTENITDAVKKADPGIFEGVGRKELKRIEGKILDKVDGFLDRNKGQLGLAEIQKIKKNLGKGLGKRNFFQKMFAPDKAVDAGEEAINIIRRNLQKSIENNVQGAREINQFMSPLLTGLGTLKSKGQLSGRIFDALFGLSFSNPTDAINDPTKFAKDFLTGIIIRRGLSTTAAKTTTSSLLKQMEKVLDTRASRLLSREAID